MMRFDPFRDIEELAQRMDRAMGVQQGRVAPALDVHEDEQGLDLTLDLPGIQPDQIKIEAENQTLTVHAERRYARDDKRTAHRVERVYGSFSRSFNIPARYDLTAVAATYEHGVLTLRVPRNEATQRRSIPVQLGTGTVQTAQPQTLTAEQPAPATPGATA